MAGLLFCGPPGNAVSFPPGQWARDPVELGEWLLGELRCTACHAAPAAVTARLSRPAPPDLRTRLAWRPAGYVEALLAGPERVRPGGFRPDLLSGLPDPAQQRRARELAAFLRTLAAPAPREPRHRHRLRFQQGRALYHQVGCVACHPPFDPSPETNGTPDEDWKLPDSAAATTPAKVAPTGPTGLEITGLAARWTPASLTAFLAAGPDGLPGQRMPAMNLTSAEATALATYLLAREPARPNPSPAEPPPDDLPTVAAGKRAFAELGCAACHPLIVAGREIKSRLRAPPLAALDPDARGGCLAPNPAPPAPRFELAPAQLTALRAALTALFRKPARPLTALDQARRELALNHCLACHERRGEGGPAPAQRPWFQTLSPVDLGDEGRFPPHLNEVGAKLRPEWLEQVLREGTRVRPYLATHMPLWPAVVAQPLAATLREADRAGPWRPTPEPPLKDATIGRRLLGPAGCACVTCHALEGQPGLTLNVMDLAWMGRRLEWTWFSRYVVDPPVLRPGTRMPSFWPDGHAVVPTILNGDADAQIRAIWSCLRQLPTVTRPRTHSTARW